MVPGHGRSDGSGPVAAILVDGADPPRDATSWAGITGWAWRESTDDVVALRHPSGAGPRLEPWSEPGPKLGKNRVHLDVRRDDEDLDPTERLLDLGATTPSAPGDLPWLVSTDPSGNEFCVIG